MGRPWMPASLIVSSEQEAADAVIQGESVAAMGGFTGRETVLTPAYLSRLVRDGDARYFLVGNGGFRGPINVGLQGLPKGVNSSTDYVTLRAGQNEAQFQLSADMSVQPGAYRVIALGRLPDEQVGAEFRLIVPGPKR